MALTYALIASSVVGAGGTNTITFSSIPQTYTDLKLVMSVRSNYASQADDILFKLNTSTTSFTTRYLYANGGTNTQASSTFAAGYAGIAVAASSTASTFNNNELYIPNYTSSNNKSFSVDMVDENNGANTYSMLLAGLWSNTAAINQIDLYPSQGTLFVQYSSFYLYGIKNS